MTLPVPLAVTATAWSASDECAFLLGYTSDDEQPEESSHASRSSLHDLKRKCHSRAVVVSCIVARLVVFAALQDLCMAAQALRFNAYGTNKFQEVGLLDISCLLVLLVLRSPAIRACSVPGFGPGFAVDGESSGTSCSSRLAHATSHGAG